MDFTFLSFLFRFLFRFLLFYYKGKPSFYYGPSHYLFLQMGVSNSTLTEKQLNIDSLSTAIFDPSFLTKTIPESKDAISLNKNINESPNPSPTQIDNNHALIFNPLSIEEAYLYLLQRKYELQPFPSQTQNKVKQFLLLLAFSARNSLQQLVCYLLLFHTYALISSHYIGSGQSQLHFVSTKHGTSSRVFSVAFAYALPYSIIIYF